MRVLPTVASVIFETNACDVTASIFGMVQMVAILMLGLVHWTVEGSFSTAQRYQQDGIQPNRLSVYAEVVCARGQLPM